MTAQPEFGRLQMGKEGGGRAVRAFAVEPQRDLVARSGEGHAGPAPADDLLEDDGGKVHERHAYRPTHCGSRVVGPWLHAPPPSSLVSLMVAVRAPVTGRGHGPW